MRRFLKVNELLLVLIQIDQNIAEYNRWYDTEHVSKPDVLSARPAASPPGVPLHLAARAGSGRGPSSRPPEDALP